MAHHNFKYNEGKTGLFQQKWINFRLKPIGILH